MLTRGWVFSHGGGGAGDSQAPSLSSSSSTWSLRDSILSPRPQNSATCSGRSSSGGMGSTARTQAPACVAHYKGKQYLRMLARSQEHWHPCLSQPLTCSSLSRRPRSSATSQLRACSSPAASRTRTKENVRVASPLHRPGPPHRRPTPTRHTEDAGTCRGLGRPPCTGASVGTQHQGVRTAAREAAQRVETAMRAEGKAGPAFVDI